MKMNIYSIYDMASAAYMRPFFLQTDGQATRMFGDIAQDAGHEIGKHPEDYVLYKIGLYDDQTGNITPFDPEKINTAVELLAQSKNPAPGALELFDKEVKSNAAN